MKITDYEIVNHGLESSQYFQGCGTTFTEFEHVVTGIGANPAEAIDDCLEMIAQGHDFGLGYLDEFEKRMLNDEKLKAWPTEPEASDEEDSEEYYHVSIRYNLAD